MLDLESPPPTPRVAVVLGALGRAMIITGIVVLLFVMFQLWGTDIQEARAQNGLRNDFDSRLDEAAEILESILTEDPRVEPGDGTPSPTTTSTTSTTTTAAAGGSDDGVTPLPTPTSTLPGGHDPEVLALFFPDDGDALARIEIPTIDVDKVVVKGVAVADLRKGPGHYNGSALPGTAGNAAIAGHRTTYGSPFNRIDELVPGDEVVVTSIQGEFRYRVLAPTEAYDGELELVEGIGDGHIIVDPGAAWVLADFGDDRLTLTACHPKLSSRQRIIVAAELVDDTVEMPAWLIEANLAFEATEQGTPALADEPVVEDAAPVSDSDESPAEDPDTTDAETADEGDTPDDAVPATDLDEGLNGERGAIPGAAAWMVAAVAFWYGGGWAGRRWLDGRWPRIGARAAGFIPAFVCIWFSFEMIDRALPAG